MTNGFKRFLKTNSSDPRQRVPLMDQSITRHATVTSPKKRKLPNFKDFVYSIFQL